MISSECRYFIRLSEDTISPSERLLVLQLRKQAQNRQRTTYVRTVNNCLFIIKNIDPRFRRRAVRHQYVPDRDASEPKNGMSRDDDVIAKYDINCC